MGTFDEQRDEITAPAELGFDQMLEAVYDELRRIAHFHQLKESRNLTLQTTALVHEAYLRLADRQTVSRPRNEAHMKALTSRVIRRVLVDHARKRKAMKRNGGEVYNDDREAELIDTGLNADILDLDQALNQLARSSQRLESITELRFFGGLNQEEIADHLGVSLRTVERDWRKARLYLLDLLQPTEEPVSSSPGD
jgi:RNA polymerase sigma factor (TIGR02999 family)